MKVRAFVAAVLCAVIGPAGLRAQQQRFLPAEVEAGGRLYLANCTGCHGPEGDGVAGINFGQGKFRRGTTDEDLVRIVVGGLPGTAVRPRGPHFRDGRCRGGNLPKRGWLPSPHIGDRRPPATATRLAETPRADARS